MKTGKLLKLRPEPRVDSLTDQLSDVGMVAACATGDRAARSMLFERHADALHRFVSHMRGADADEVDDLVQVTFLRAFDAAKRFRGATAHSWLFGIAANVVKEYARKEIRRKRALGVVAEELPAVATPRDPTLSRLPDAIAALGHELRAAFVLVDLEGERGIDAAAALGIPQGTLWRRVFEARTALRRALQGGES